MLIPDRIMTLWARFRSSLGGIKMNPVNHDVRTNFLTQKVNQRITVMLMDGNKFEGILLRFDDSCIIINPSVCHTGLNNKEVMIERHAYSYIV
jgi:small nuclear ribonucleoprotein (snRNP)-like protein